MFHLSDISKSFGSLRAVAPTDLDIPTGQTTVLIGPSGCGKSTLLRLMNGLVAPDTGSVTFDGDAVTAASATSLRRRMGYVIQQGGLFPHLTGQQNITVMAHHIGWPASDIEARLQTLTDLTRFPPDALTRYPSELSGGQRQRVSLMRALMLDPDALLLDEPLGALDPMVRYDLQTELADIFKSLGKTVVLVTHDLFEAAHFADDIVLLRDGAVEQRASMKMLLAEPASPFVEKFIGAQRGLTQAPGL
ncbi:MAG: osmoprotectant transport system ATP-binding protein [Paracoccaceae bacterium]|jgi:osmoprotectant transport system ATP-binding protein